MSSLPCFPVLLHVHTFVSTILLVLCTVCGAGVMVLEATGATGERSHEREGPARARTA